MNYDEIVKITEVEGLRYEIDTLQATLLDLQADNAELRAMIQHMAGLASGEIPCPKLEN